VDEEKCVGCGICWSKCPIKNIPSEFDMGLSMRTAIYVPFPQAVPNIPVIDRKNCVYFIKGRCKACEMFCEAGAIDFDQEDEIITEKVGAIVVATGFDLLSEDRYGEYGEGRFEDVINSLQFERMLSATGPTEGKIKRLSDGREPKDVVFIQCIGSRDISKGISYCSKICCMYSAKHAMLYKHKVHDGRAYVFYMDIRAGGKNYEEFVRRAIEEDGVVYLRGRVSRLFEKDGKVVVRGADTLSGSQVEIKADLVVLATAIAAQKDAAEMAKKIGISYDQYHFFTEAHPKLRPIETNTAGVFLAGACQAPKDIPESVAQGTAAAAKVLELFSRDTLMREPLIVSVDQFICNGCFLCKMACPYDAIEEEGLPIRVEGVKRIKRVAKVNEGKCQGCGICVSACPSKVIMLKGFTDQQIYEEVIHAI
jgi:heterodisulfide reductase subunit A